MKLMASSHTATQSNTSNPRVECLPDYDVLASVAIGEQKRIAKRAPAGGTSCVMVITPGGTPAFISEQSNQAYFEMMRRVWNRACWGMHLPVARHEFETIVVIPCTAVSTEVRAPEGLKKRLSLDEAWHRVGEVFEELQAERRAYREREAREFFGLPDDGADDL